MTDTAHSLPSSTTYAATAEEGGGGQPLPAGKPPRPTACTECHAAKVKCDKKFPCSRCIRLSKECVPHVSRQGRGSKPRRPGGAGGKKRRRDSDEGTAAAAATSGSKSTATSSSRKRPAKAPQLTEDTVAASATSLRPNHFGLRYLIRSWVSFAVRRRSFALLAKASTLAARVGVTMDSVLCGESENRLGLTGPSAMLPPEMVGPMDFLLPALLKPARMQELGTGRLRWSELPPDLLSATGCCVAGRGGGGGGGECQNGADSEKIKACQDAAEVAAVVEQRGEEEFLGPVLGRRWILVREMRQGKSRYFVSPAFERDIASWASIHATWVANEREVFSLFMPLCQREPWARALMHQISLNERPGLAPRSSRYETQIQIKGVSKTEAEAAASSSNSSTAATLTVDVDAVFCLKIIDLDHSFFYVEFLREEVKSANVLASLAAVASDAAPSRSSTPPQGGQAQMPSVPGGSEPNPPWLDLDDLDDLGMDDLMDILASCPLEGSLAE